MDKIARSQQPSAKSMLHEIWMSGTKEDLRTTNPIESTFATVRLRTYRTKGGRQSAGLPGHGIQID